MAPPHKNSRKKIASLGQQSLRSCMNLHVQNSRYDHFQGTGISATLQKVACEALRECTYRQTQKHKS